MTGKGFAETVLMNDVGKGGYSIRNMDGGRAPISSEQASELYKKIGNTSKVHVDVGRNAAGRFINQSMTFFSW